jgi:hypothetical protein
VFLRAPLHQPGGLAKSLVEAYKETTASNTLSENQHFAVGKWNVGQGRSGCFDETEQILAVLLASGVATFLESAGINQCCPKAILPTTHLQVSECFVCRRSGLYWLSRSSQA